MFMVLIQCPAIYNFMTDSQSECSHGTRRCQQHINKSLENEFHSKTSPAKLQPPTFIRQPRQAILTGRPSFLKLTRKPPTSEPRVTRPLSDQLCLNRSPSQLRLAACWDSSLVLICSPQTSHSAHIEFPPKEVLGMATCFS